MTITVVLICIKNTVKSFESIKKILFHKFGALLPPLRYASDADKFDSDAVGATDVDDRASRL